MLIVALIPFSQFLPNSFISHFHFLFFLSLVDSGPIEKCLTELKTPNILPGEREDIKGQVRNTVIGSSEEFFNFFFINTYLEYHGLVQYSASFSAALGFLRAPPNFILGGIFNKLKLKEYHCCYILGNWLLKQNNLFLLYINFYLFLFVRSVCVHIWLLCKRFFMCVCPLCVSSFSAYFSSCPASPNCCSHVSQ